VAAQLSGESAAAGSVKKPGKNLVLGDHLRDIDRND
jgi:hypothetical protein